MWWNFKDFPIDSWVTSDVWAIHQHKYANNECQSAVLFDWTDYFFFIQRYTNAASHADSVFYQ